MGLLEGPFLANMVQKCNKNLSGFDILFEQTTQGVLLEFRGFIRAQFGSIVVAFNYLFTPIWIMFHTSMNLTVQENMFFHDLILLVRYLFCVMFNYSCIVVSFIRLHFIIRFMIIHYFGTCIFVDF